MAVALTSEIIIGNLRTRRLHDVRVKRSIHSFVDTATITLPSIAKILRKDGQLPPQEITTGKAFKDGDKVSIKLGYDDNNIQEFEGFVTRRNLNMPLQVECEGYSYQLRRNKVSGYWKEISVKELMQKAVADTDITVQCTTDIKLTNVKATDATGVKLLEFILKETEGAISIFFISPKVLWAGLIYSDTGQGKDVAGLGTAKYRLGFNCPRENDIKERIIEDNPVVVNFLKRTPNGTIFNDVSSETAKLARRHKKVLNHLKETFLKVLAQEKQDRLNYLGYEGKLKAFAIPYCAPSWVLWVEDSRYPELDGWYLCESTDLKFDEKGAIREIELGVKVGWKNG